MQRLEHLVDRRTVVHLVHRPQLVVAVPLNELLRQQVLVALRLALHLLQHGVRQLHLHLGACLRLLQLDQILGLTLDARCLRPLLLTQQLRVQRQRHHHLCRLCLGSLERVHAVVLPQRVMILLLDLSLLRHQRRALRLRQCALAKLINDVRVGRHRLRPLCDHNLQSSVQLHLVLTQRARQVVVLLVEVRQRNLLGSLRRTQLRHKEAHHLEHPQQVVVLAGTQVHAVRHVRRQSVVDLNLRNLQLDPVQRTTLHVLHRIQLLLHKQRGALGPRTLHIQTRIIRAIEHRTKATAQRHVARRSRKQTTVTQEHTDAGSGNLGQHFFEHTTTSPHFAIRTIWQRALGDPIGDPHWGPTHVPREIPRKTAHSGDHAVRVQKACGDDPSAAQTATARVEAQVQAHQICRAVKRPTRVCRHAAAPTRHCQRSTTNRNITTGECSAGSAVSTTVYTEPRAKSARSAWSTTRHQRTSSRPELPPTSWHDHTRALQTVGTSRPSINAVPEPTSSSDHKNFI